MYDTPAFSLLSDDFQLQPLLVSVYVRREAVHRIDPARLSTILIPNVHLASFNPFIDCTFQEAVLEKNMHTNKL